MRLFGGRPRRHDAEIAPEDIFIDSASEFDRSKFEGRLERPLGRSTYLGLMLVLGGALSILALRALDLQIVNGEMLAKRSAQNSLSQTELFAPRGIITDMHGTVLVDNIEAEDGAPRRRYLYPELGNIVGYVSYPKKDAKGNYYETEERGVAGIEARYDHILAGENGTILLETDAVGNIRSQGASVAATPGKTLTLALDASLERHLATAVREVARRAGFIAGAAVIMDVKTGAVRAIVSYPSYDSAIMSEGAPKETIASYYTMPGHPFIDHAIAGIYIPGSVVKPFVAAGALTDGIVTEGTIINDNALLTVPDPYNPGESYKFTGWRALGPMDVRKAIAWSSDIYFYTVGGGHQGIKGLGIDRLTYWYRTFGLGTTTGIDLSGEAAGVLATPEWKEKVLKEPWYLGNTYHTAIGQYSMQVTPLQMARATAALVNGGYLVTPTMLAGAPVASTSVPVAPDILRIVREGMRLTVTGALAQGLNLPFVAVAAKTGTAQVGVNNEYDNSWVEGFFPYDNPQYSFAVVLERGPAGAGSAAVTVMKEFFNALHQANSPYVGGTGQAPAAASSTERTEQ